MKSSPNVSEITSILKEPSISSILTILMDGRFYTSSELAYMAGTKQQTVKLLLSKLLNANLIIMEKHGRHRYFQIADGDVAKTIEPLLPLSHLPEIRRLKQPIQMKALKPGRTCYDHLAGELGVKLTESMLKEGIIKKGNLEFIISSKGERFFMEFGLDIPKLRKKQRSFSRICLDWSERKHHLAGALGSALTLKLFEKNWIERLPSSRAVKVTEKGRIGLEKFFNLTV